MRNVSLTVNGDRVDASVDPRTHLADFVRDTLRLTGTHLGCEHGVCGACTVLIDGAPMRSCIAYAVACDGANVRTIEGFDGDPLMRALRAAFTRHHALQCGYCTPGMLITAYDIVVRLPDAGDARVREELAGNLCRCTGYAGIVEAVKAVLDEAQTAGGATPGMTGTGPASAPGTDGRPGHDAAHEGSVRRSQDAGAGHVVGGSARRPSASQATGRQRSGAPHAVSDHEPPTRLDGPVTTHEVSIPVAPQRLWSVLHDVALVVGCLPGAALTGPADADPLPLEIAVALGPIRARFEGTARITYDEHGRTGRLEGSGHDPRSRTSSEGSVNFSVVESQAEGSVLVLEMRYTTRGPLAQFSRGAVVDAVVEQLLERFAANLAAAASGRTAAVAPRLRGISFVLAALRRCLRSKLSGTKN